MWDSMSRGRAQKRRSGRQTVACACWLIQLLDVTLHGPLLSTHRPAAVDDNGLTGDVASRGRQQKLDDAGDLFDADELPLGHGLEHDTVDDLGLSHATCAR